MGLGVQYEIRTVPHTAVNNFCNIVGSKVQRNFRSCIGKSNSVLRSPIDNVGRDNHDQRSWLRQWPKYRRDGSCSGIIVRPASRWSQVYGRRSSAWRRATEHICRQACSDLAGERSISRTRPLGTLHWSSTTACSRRCAIFSTERRKCHEKTALGILVFPCTQRHSDRCHVLRSGVNPSITPGDIQYNYS